MRIKQYSWNVVDSNSWLIIDNNSGLLIDAVYNEVLFKELDKLETVTIILTHAHFDHIIGLNKIITLIPTAIVRSTQKCNEYLKNKYRNMSSSASAFLAFYKNGQKKDIKIEPFICDIECQTFEEQSTIKWYNHEITLKAVRGHSDDGLIVVLDKKLLFSGDTLLHTPSITRFRTGNSIKFWTEDIPMLKKMNQTMIVYPGHGACGVLKKMISINETPCKYKTCLS